MKIGTSTLKNNLATPNKVQYTHIPDNFILKYKTRHKETGSRIFIVAWLSIVEKKTKQNRNYPNVYEEMNGQKWGHILKMEYHIKWINENKSQK